MNRRTIGIAAVVVLLVVGALGAGLYLGGSGAPTQASQPTETPEAVSADDVPPAVEESQPGAQALYQELQGDYDGLRLFITQRGEVVVVYNSTAQHGPELKSEMQDIALVYSEVMGEYPETGGLTVQANGVEMLASSDTALAHNEGKINEEAYFKTLHFGTMESDNDGGN